MSILLTQIRANIHRLLAVIIALTLGTGFLAGTMLFADALDQSLRNSVTREYRLLDVIVSTYEPDPNGEIAAEIVGMDGVKSVESRTTSWLQTGTGDTANGFQAVNVPTDPVLRDAFTIKEGRLPEANGEIALDSSTVRMVNGSIGDQVTLPKYDAIGNLTDSKKTFTIVGELKEEEAFDNTVVNALLTDPDLREMNPAPVYPVLYVTLDPGVSEDEMASKILATFNPPVSDLSTEETGEVAASTEPDRVDVQTAGYMANIEMMDHQNLADLIRNGTIAFALIAMVVAAMVVSNTLQILIAQRTREIALQRCIGVTGSQVRRAVLLEALVVGAIGSIAGIVLAWVIANATLLTATSSGGSSIIPRTIGLTPGMVMFPLLAGLVTTLGAAWLPAIAATKISPLAALRSAQLPPLGNSNWHLRTMIGAFLILAGGFFLGIGMLLSLSGDNLTGTMIGVFGGAVSSLGVLILSVFMVPWVMARLGGLAERFAGVPGKVAVSNCARNPRRTTSTAVALMIGVALVSMMTVGGAMVKESVADDIDAYAPVDVRLMIPNPGSVSIPDVMQEILGVEDIESLSQTGNIIVTAPRAPQDLGELEATFLNPDDARRTVRAPEILRDLDSGSVLLSPYMASSLEVFDGDQLTLTGASSSVDLTIHVQPIPGDLIMNTSDARKLDANAAINGAWIRMDDTDDLDTVRDEIFSITDRYGLEPTIDGQSVENANNNEILDRLVLVVTGLLGVAVLISLIGIGNTLSLSVIERTRESALLRSLGCTRKQLRTMLAVEGVMLAISGSVIGVVVGVFYGLVGGVTLLGDEIEPGFAMPVGRLLLFILVAVVAGFLASVLPARRAATADPVVALAET